MLLRSATARLAQNAGRVKKLEFLVAALVAGITLLFAVLALEPERVDTLSQFRAGAPLRIGYALEAPFVMLDETGRPTGTEPEVLRQALRALGGGRTIWLHGDFANLIHELRSGRIDIICAGMQATDERSAIVAFSRPTMQIRTGLLVVAGNPGDLDSFEAIAQREGVTLAALAGSIEARMARDAGVPYARLVLFPDAHSAFVGVRSGRVDAFALSMPSLRQLTARDSAASVEIVELVDAGRQRSSGQIAFAFRREDRTLREAIDRAMGEFVGSDAHRQLLRRFGVGDVALPSMAGKQP